jgi:FixJ family two-component response regulator
MALVAARSQFLSQRNWNAAMPKKRVITIVDDDESLRQALMGLMRALDFASEAYACAEDFLKSGRVQRTSCLIADLRMPGMSGLQLHHRLVASGNPVPTILITAHPDDGIRERALRAGIICYLTKPFDEDDLLACIRSALEHGNKNGKRS